MCWQAWLIPQKTSPTVKHKHGAWETLRAGGILRPAAQELWNNREEDIRKSHPDLATKLTNIVSSQCVKNGGKIRGTPLIHKKDVWLLVTPALCVKICSFYISRLSAIGNSQKELPISQFLDSSFSYNFFFPVKAAELNQEEKEIPFF